MDNLLVGTLVTGQKGQCNYKGYFAWGLFIFLYWRIEDRLWLSVTWHPQQQFFFYITNQKKDQCVAVCASEEYVETMISLVSFFSPHFTILTGGRWPTVECQTIFNRTYWPVSGASTSSLCTIHVFNKGKKKKREKNIPRKCHPCPLACFLQRCLTSTVLSWSKFQGTKEKTPPPSQLTCGASTASLQCIQTWMWVFYLD